MMCVGQRHGRRRREPGRTGVYAAQHPTGRECVSGGTTAGGHVPTSRDGKNHLPCSVVSPKRKKPFWFNRSFYFIFFNNRTVSN